jgi:hypothetical protein
VAARQGAIPANYLTPAEAPVSAHPARTRARTSLTRSSSPPRTCDSPAVLSELIQPADVALEIDGVDQESLGRSVVVQGRAQGVAEPAQLVRMWTVGRVFPGPPGSGTYSSRSFPTG